MDYKDILVIIIVMVIAVVVSKISPSNPIGLMVKYINGVFKRKK